MCWHGWPTISVFCGKSEAQTGPITRFRQARLLVPHPFLSSGGLSLDMSSAALPGPAASPVSASGVTSAHAVRGRCPWRSSGSLPLNDRRKRKQRQRPAADADERVREVLDLMLAGQWSTGKAVELSKKYDLTLVAIQDWSRQAGRIIRFQRGAPEDFRERILANLDFAGRFALDLDKPDVKAYITAQVEQARLLRLDRPEDDATEQLPVEQLAAALRALGHEVILHVTEASNGEGGDDEPGSEPSGSGSAGARGK